MITFDQNGMKVGWVSIWGDWAVHLTQGSTMAYRTLIPRENPVLMGAPFSYPFAVNLVSAILVRTLNISLFTAFVTVSYICCILFIYVVYFVFYRMLGTTLKAILATLVFMLNGGLGFAWYIKDVIKSPTLRTALDFSTEYTHLYKIGIEWINIITSMLIPQRSFVFGFPIALLVLAILHRYAFSYRTTDLTKHKKQTVVVLGSCVLLLGFMPLIHMHSMLALAIIGGLWWLWRFLSFDGKTLWRDRLHFFLMWCAVAIGVVAIAWPILHVFYPETLSSTASGAFIRWYPWWYVNSDAIHHGELSWLMFWWLNWGIVLPLALIRWVFLPIHKKTLWFPFLFLFVLLNFFLFQPHIWDNTKMLVWASVGVSALAADAIGSLMKHRRILLKILAFLFLLLATSSGLLDAYMLTNKKVHSWYMYSQKDLEMAEFIKTATVPETVFLTSDVHNNAITNLTGRRIVMGYRGWLWTYGIDYSSTEKDVFAIYHADPGFEKLLKKYNVSFVAFDSAVRNNWSGNEDYFRKRYPLWHRSDDYTIYDVRGIY